MKYIPFTEIEQIERYYCRYINHIKYGMMSVIGCKKTRDSYVEIYCVDKDGKEKIIDSGDLLSCATFNNHPFGLEIGEKENEDF